MKNIELAADALFAGYDGKTIVSDVSITIPQNKIVSFWEQMDVENLLY